MRLAILAAALLAAGASGAYFISDATEAPFGKTYILLFEENPELVGTHVARAMEECASASAEFRRGTQTVKTLAARTFARSMLLTVKGTSPEEASRELTFWVLENAKQLNSNEKAAYLELVRLLNEPDAALCIMSSLKDSAEFKLDADAASWAIRS